MEPHYTGKHRTLNHYISREEGSLEDMKELTALSTTI